MSYSLSVQGSPAELASKLEDVASQQGQNYSDKTNEHIELGISTVGNIAKLLESKDNGQFGVSFYGHANQGEGDAVRDAFTISVNPLTPPAGAGG